MAGFIGVKPSQETVRLLLANLQAVQRTYGERLVAGADPHLVPEGGRSTLRCAIGMNAALIEVFEGLLEDE